jgi:hypothetical protein
VNWIRNAERLRPAAIAAAVLFLCLPAVSGQRNAAPAARPRFAPQQRQAMRPQNQQKQFQNQQRQYQNQPMNNGAVRPGQAYPGEGARAGAYGNQGYAGANRPGYQSPPGHLGDWLNQHRNLSGPDQERALRNNPAFNHLDSETQQRLVNRLHELNQMPEARRQQRVEENEMLEHMSPQQHMQTIQAGRRFSALSPDRQIAVKRAFQDLRAVPPDQRETVLNSARYQSGFSPDERDILSNLMRAEPYEPAR